MTSNRAIAVTLPDGSVRNYDAGTTVREVAASIGRRLEEAAVAGKIDGKEVDLSHRIEKNCSLAIITRESKEGLEVLRHSTAHLLAQAIKELYPGSQITIGPVIEDGFYYDIDTAKVITNDDLPTIEKKMEEIAARKLDVRREELSRPDAIKLFQKVNDPYKIEIITGLPEGEVISAYHQGDFVDLCTGPHVPNTAKLGKFKLLSVAGAYWRGDEKNKMLQRIYGTAWATQKELDEYLRRIEEARKRDHRRLGPEIGLFTFLPISPAMPFYLPKGTLIFNMLGDFMRQEMRTRGYQEVITPQVMNSDLWKTSGHWDNYQDNMFLIAGDTPKDAPTAGLKPMNCPGHMALFGSTKHSYRELPLRFSEFTRLFRNERAGVTHGILRTRAFCQDDAHIFCTEAQIESESLALIEHTFRVYRIFGFDKVDVKLALRPEKRLGTDELWDRAEGALANALKKAGVAFENLPGEGAFYGPKIEFHIRDSIGRFWQCGTLQVDYQMPARFKLEYADSDGSMKTPVVLHRAILGSLERFFGILIEHHGGHFPLWLAPIQVDVVNVTIDQEVYAKSVVSQVESWGLRVQGDFRNEKLGYKIREAQLQRIPLMLVIGNKEVENKTVSLRRSNGETVNDLTLEALRQLLDKEARPTEGDSGGSKPGAASH